MDHQKILLVCRAFYPDISPRSFRATELAKEFARQGHDVTVLFPTLGRDYKVFERDYNLKIKNVGNPRFKEIVLNGGKIRLLLKRVLRRILQVLFEYPDIQIMFLVEKALAEEDGYDLLVSIAVPHAIHWGVARIWDRDRRIAKTWIADCGDPFMFARLDTYKKPFYFKYLETSFCRKCNFISIPFEAMREQFYPEFREKIVVIPQGFYLDEIDQVEIGIPNKNPIFIYAGSIIPGIRDLALFLEYLISLNMDFLFIVFTAQRGWFTGYKRELREKLVLRDYIDRKSLLTEMRQADFLINVDTVLDNDGNTEAIPSKLIDYAVAGRPILNLNSARLDTQLVDDFLRGDYSKARVIDLSRYDISSVVRLFIKLA